MGIKLNKDQRSLLEQSLINFCNGIGFHVDLKAPSHQRAWERFWASLAQDGPTSWVCNQCGSPEFTDSVSEDDIERLTCTGCGGNEFHREPRIAAEAART